MFVFKLQVLNCQQHLTELTDHWTPANTLFADFTYSWFSYLTSHSSASFYSCSSPQVIEIVAAYRLLQSLPNQSLPVSILVSHPYTLRCSFMCTGTLMISFSLLVLNSINMLRISKFLSPAQILKINTTLQICLKPQICTSNCPFRGMAKEKLLITSQSLSTQSLPYFN